MGFLPASITPPGSSFHPAAVFIITQESAPHNEGTATNMQDIIPI
jgi:hypothetical protein